MPHVETALRVYGHQTVQMENDCYDSKLEVPFRNQNAVRFKNTVNCLSPAGVNPHCLFTEGRVSRTLVSPNPISAM